MSSFAGTTSTGVLGEYEGTTRSRDFSAGGSLEHRERYASNFFEMSAMFNYPGPRGAYESGLAKMREAQVTRSPCAECLGSSHPPSIDSQYRPR